MTVATPEETDEMLVEEQSWVELQCDMKFEPSDTLKTLLGDKWTCQEGIVERMEDVVGEFKAYRDLRAVRALLLGPPGAGCEQLASVLGQEYTLPVVTLESIVSEIRDAATSKKDERAREALAREEAKTQEVGEGEDAAADEE